MEAVSSVVFAPDGSTLAAGGSDGSIILWNPVSGETMRQLTGPAEGVLSLAFSPDGRMLASGGADGKMDTRRPQRIQPDIPSRPVHLFVVWPVVFSR